jgi:hypothetical protein
MVRGDQNANPALPQFQPGERLCRRILQFYVYNASTFEVSTVQRLKQPLGNHLSVNELVATYSDLPLLCGIIVRPARPPIISEAEEKHADTSSLPV